MAKFADDSIMDAGLDVVKLNATTLTVTAGQPATLSSATTQGGQMLARVTITSTDFTGPANGDTSGRKITVNQQTGIAVSASGDADHVTLVTGSSIKYITTATTQTLTAGNTLTVNAWDIELQDPT